MSELVSGLNLKDLIAIWGALTGTLALGWTIIWAIQDRGKLKVFAMVGRQIGDSKDRVFITVTNVGRRKRVVTKIAGEYSTSVNGKSAFVIIPTQIPKILDEGEFVSEFWNGFEERIDLLKRMYAIDSLGREYDVPRDVLRKIKADAVSSNRK